MKIEELSNKNRGDLLKRPVKNFEEVEQIVNTVFNELLLNGDAAIKKYTQLFDKIKLDDFLVSDDEINEAIKNTAVDLKNAIQLAKKNIEAFHTAQKTPKISVETMKGVLCWQEKRPINSIGLYIPGGTAPLFSTVLMLAVPAKIAGCDEIILCTPPDKNGNIHPAILYTASLCGVTKIYKVGGIQAIGALTFGTATIPKVSKIFGPGNQYVTVAKQMATKYGVAIDMPAGPSELLVMADSTANASYIASDLLSQAEHGTDSQVVLIATSKEILQKTQLEIDKQLENLPRKEIAANALKNSKLILVKNDIEALNFINQYAPEHFIICTENQDFFVDNIQNAGSVFIGNFTPESAGDYASGTNHTLPTNGYAKAYSGVNLDSFTKSITFQKITKEGLKNIGKSIEIMAEKEGLIAHKNAVSIRLKDIL